MNLLLLDRNENQYGPAPACSEVLKVANLGNLSLYSRSYTLGRKSELSYRLSREFGIPEKQLLLSYGSEDMLKQLVHCYLHAGETLLLPQYSWWYYRSVAGEVFGNQVTYPVRERSGAFEYDPDEIIALSKTHRPAVILIASPNNPTGNSMPLDALDHVVSRCTSSVIILDEAYHGFAEQDSDHLPVLLGSHGNIAVLRTFSKLYALAGLRIGYAAVSGELTQILAYSARYLGYNQLSEQIALAALDDQAYYRDITERIRSDRERYSLSLATVPGLTPYRSDANFLLVRFPPDRKGYLQHALLQRRIVVKFLDDPGLNDCMRITVGTTEQNDYVISSIKEIAEHIPGRAQPISLTDP